MRSANLDTNLQSVASGFVELAEDQDQKNPFRFAEIALARCGELQCYVKLGYNEDIIISAVAAARWFVKSAAFFYELTRDRKKSWSNPLSDAIECYRTAIGTLQVEEKYSLLSVTLMELGKAEADFGFLRSAADVYGEVISIYVTRKLRPRLLIEAVKGSVECYVKCGEMDSAVVLVDAKITNADGGFKDAISRSKVLKEEVAQLKVVFALLKIIRGDEVTQCIAFTEDMRVFLNNLALAKSNADMTRMRELVNTFEARESLTYIQKVLIDKIMGK